MKRVKITVILAILFFLAGIALAALTWHSANQFTVAWNDVSTNVNGDTVPADEISYEAFLANAVTDPNKTNPTSVWTGSETQAVLTLNTEGQYYIGVKAIRTVDGAKQSESDVIWSDDPTYCQDGVTFGVQHFLALTNPGGLRAQ